jgi:hypothetical protein
MKTTVAILFIILLNACQFDNSKNGVSSFFKLTPSKTQHINPSGTTIQTRVATPENFKRTDEIENSFGQYLRNLPVLSHKTKVKLFNGNLKKRQDVHAAIIDMSIGNRDLQQCADAVMRLRSEYLWNNENYEDLHFNFTNGFNAKYSRWMQGERIRINGDRVTWARSTSASNTHDDLMDYLTMVFSYAGTLSLAQELNSISIKEIEIGDVFIKGGAPGHAVIVVDKAIHTETGEVLVLLAQSYMPAQNIHLLNNFSTNKDINPWYSIEDFQQVVLTPEWKFKPTDLKRFKKNETQRHRIHRDNFLACTAFKIPHKFSL